MAKSATQRTLALLTSGGDCAGLNGVIRSVVHRAVEGYGWRVIGIRQGTMGLLHRPVDAVELGLNIDDGGLLRMGGTILGTTNKGDPFAFPAQCLRQDLPSRLSSSCAEGGPHVPAS